MKTLIRYSAAALIFAFAIAVSAQTTAFNYQGRLTDGGNPANGAFQMQFKLFDSLGGPGQVGATLTDLPVTVTQGVFSVKLDFGANALSGANRWLEIAVRHNSGESYVTLSPREQVTSSPYAVRTLSAATADTATNATNATNATTATNALNLGGVAASEYVTNSTVGSTFIRNQATLQTANFNINGSGFIGGNVGIGTTTPFSRLGIQTINFSYGMTHTNGTIRFGSYVDPTAGWFGTQTNHPLNFFTNGGLAQMTLLPNGNVGIGTVNPLSGLEVRGTGLATQQRITDATSGNSLVLQGGSESNMKITGYNYGTSTAVPLYLSVDGANTILNSGGGNVGIGTTTPNARLQLAGDATQTFDKGGFVKAMVFVLANGTISRCYNGVTGSSTGTCGFSIISGGAGYAVNFGFSTVGRFFSLTTAGNTESISGRITTVQLNEVSVRTFRTPQAEPNLGVASDFYLIVY